MGGRERERRGEKDKEKARREDRMERVGKKWKREKGGREVVREATALDLGLESEPYVLEISNACSAHTLRG